jgi:hypothetical protein
VGKQEGRRPLGRPRRRWVDNIRMDLVDVGWGDVDWIRIGTGGELLWIRFWAFGFHKLLGKPSPRHRHGHESLHVHPHQFIIYCSSYPSTLRNHQSSEECRWQMAMRRLGCMMMELDCVQTGSRAFASPPALALVRTCGREDGRRVESSLWASLVPRNAIFKTPRYCLPL